MAQLNSSLRREHRGYRNSFPYYIIRAPVKFFVLRDNSRRRMFKPDK